jgi:hypothetical protein
LPAKRLAKDTQNHAWGSAGYRLRRMAMVCVPRMLRSAISAFTRIFDALWFGVHDACRAGPGSLRSSAKRCIALPD